MTGSRWALSVANRWTKFTNEDRDGERMRPRVTQAKGGVSRVRERSAGRNLLLCWQAWLTSGPSRLSTRSIVQGGSLFYKKSRLCLTYTNKSWLIMLPSLVNSCSTSRTRITATLSHARAAALSHA